MTTRQRARAFALLLGPALVLSMGVDECSGDVDIGDDGDAGRSIDAGPGPYDPCAGLSCGDTCQLCPPSDPDCVETAVVKMCQPNGACAPTTPECGSTYDPCAGLSCGDSCRLCAPDDADCVETEEVKQCDASGMCSSGAAECGASPCEGLACGAQCSTCPPDAEACPAVVEFCQADGSCSPSAPTCEAPDPCEGLSCGDRCSTCAPGEDCDELIPSYCQADGTCGGAEPECPLPGSCEGLPCGTPCTLCAPGEDCDELIPSYCQADGACGGGEPTCPAGPCDGLVCGERCSTCTGEVCPAVVEWCQPDGSCGYTEPECGAACGSRGLPPCGEGQFCNWPSSADCGRADAPGTCTPIPGGCTREYDPVCGCDGETYSNACTAHAAGVSVEYRGECTGSDGCRVAGCSGQLCVGPGDPGASTCEWHEYYACYRDASCERQPSGSCGWTPTDELRACIADAGGPSTHEP